MPSKLR